MKCLGLLLVLACLCAHYKKVSGRYPEGCLYERGVLKCMHAGLTQLPPSLPFDASEIDLQYNEIEEIRADYFLKFSKLNQLLLGNNRIFSIEDGSFDGLSKLRKLALNRNDLTQLKSNSFIGLNKLTSLDLSYNSIGTIASDTFNPLTSIRKINFYGNALTCTCELNWMVKLAQEGILDPVPFCTDPNDSKIKPIFILQQYCRPQFFEVDDNSIRKTLNSVKREIGNAEKITKNDLSSSKNQRKNFFRNLRFPPKRALPLAKAAEVFERTIEKLIEKVNSKVHYNITFIKNLRYQEFLTPEQLDLLSSLSECTKHRGIRETCDDQCFNRNFRTFDGACNNFERPMLGSSMSPLMRLVPPRYENNFNFPIGWSINKPHNGYRVPSTRKISLELLSAPTVNTNEDLSSMLMQWGQFLDHDLSLTPTSMSNAEFENGKLCEETCKFNSPCFPIPVDDNDPRVTDQQCLIFMRSSAVCDSEKSSSRFTKKAIHRQQVNIITSFIDASNVYGSSEEEASNLRDQHTNQGLLRVGEASRYNPNKRLLPSNQEEAIDCAVDPNRAHVPCFQAGDHRNNEQLGLLSMHTLWFREHNRLARLLKRMNSHWDGDQTYHQTRKIIGAMMQHITYEHWLPEILGPAGMAKLGEYQGYDPSVDPSIANAFSTAAFRFGHTLINPIMPRLNSSFLPIKEGNLLLHKAFFAPFRIVEEGGIDPVIRGLFATGCKLVKPGEFLNEELTERLFALAHKIALDLAAFNVQRGRDHGLGSYNSYRTFCGLRKAESFNDLSREITSQMVRNKLQSIYGHPDNIDLFVGGLSETPLPGAQVGETFSCIIANQFKRLRDGDRFWYKKTEVFSKEQLMEIEKSSLARIICDNSDGITQVPNNVFRLAKNKSAYKQCSSGSIPTFDLQPWSNCCEVCSGRSKRSLYSAEQRKKFHK